MTKTKTTAFLNLTLWLGALVFTLSAVPGFYLEAEEGSLTLSSSSDCHTLGATLYTENSAECLVEGVDSNGRRFSQKVKATKKSQVPQWGQPTVAGPGKEVVELETETEAKVPCALCGGSRPSIEKKTVEASQNPDLKTIAEGMVHLTVRRAAAEAKDDDARAARIENCEETEQGKKIVGLPRTLECRVSKIKGMEEGEAELHFDQHIRKQLHQMIVGSAGEEPSARAGNLAVASRLVFKLNTSIAEGNSAGSVYLNAAVQEMMRLGQAQREQTRTDGKKDVSDDEFRKELDDVANRRQHQAPVAPAPAAKGTRPYGTDHFQNRLGGSTSDYQQPSTPGAARPAAPPCVPRAGKTCPVVNGQGANPPAGMTSTGIPKTIGQPVFRRN